MTARPRTVQSLKRLSFLVIALVGLVSIPLSSAAAPHQQATEPFPTVQIPPKALQLSQEVGANAQRRTGPSAKLDAALMDVVAAARQADASAEQAAANAAIATSNHRIQIQIITHADAVKAVASAVRSAGGEVTGTGADNTILQAWVPADQIEALARLDDVYRIRRPATAVETDHVEVGNSTTEALGAFNVPAWHAAGFNGSGVKVGIIDGGFIGYRALLGTDLPAQVTVKNFIDGQTDAQVDGNSEHGTACAEIIYDIAPNASMFLASTQTDIDFLEAIDWMIAQDVDVVSMSIGWLSLTPGDGTGHLSSGIQRLRSAGILPLVAAGNEREEHWGGTFTDTDNDGIHEFISGQGVNVFGPGNGNAYSIPAGYPISVEMRWDNWTGPVNQDYDLYVLRWSGSAWEIFAGSENVQDGTPGQTPTEYVFTTTAGPSTMYGFGIVRHNSTRNVHFEVFASNPTRIDRNVPARSLSQPADAPSALTVAALDARSTAYSQEPYSSEGPTNGPGGRAAGGIMKPNIGGFANVSTQAYGPGLFNGTSSATPHVAGAAALVFSAFPSYTPDLVQNFLQTRAVDMGTPGVDTQFGFGRVQLGGAPTNRISVPFVQR